MEKGTLARWNWQTVQNFLILPPNERRPIYIIVPHTEPMDYELLKAIYEVQKFA